MTSAVRKRPAASQSAVGPTVRKRPAASQSAVGPDALRAAVSAKAEKLRAKRYKPTGRGYRGCGEEAGIHHPYVGVAERLQGLAEAAHSRGAAECGDELLALARDFEFGLPRLREEYSRGSPRYMSETLLISGRLRGVGISFESTWDWRSERCHDHHLAETLHGVVSAALDGRDVPLLKYYRYTKPHHPGNVHEERLTLYPGVAEAQRALQLTAVGIVDFIPLLCAVGVNEARSQRGYSDGTFSMLSFWQSHSDKHAEAAVGLGREASIEASNSRPDLLSAGEDDSEDGCF